MRQAEFVAALLDPALAVPGGLTDPAGRPAGRRFAVYRNNVAVGLTEALENGFPVLRALLGEAFFRAMAGVYLRAHPPRSRMMAGYGEDMPGFLATFPPVAHLPYLPDVARLELALRASYHAADADAINPARVAALPPERLMAARLRLAPSVRLVRSDWPIHGIWAANTHATPTPAMHPQDVLITREGFDPAPQLLPPRGADFLAAVLHGHTIATALTAAGEAHDLAATLGLLIAQGAICDLEEDP